MSGEDEAKDGREKRLLKLIALLRRIVDERWFGKLTVKFEEGTVVYLVEEHVRKL